MSSEHPAPVNRDSLADCLRPLAKVLLAVWRRRRQEQEQADQTPLAGPPETPAKDEKPTVSE
jgi:hypothetical protein